MGMFSFIGAEGAAKEILAFVESKLLENDDKPEVVKVLLEIKVKTEQIKAEAEGGYY